MIKKIKIYICFFFLLSLIIFIFTEYINNSKEISGKSLSKCIEAEIHDIKAEVYKKTAGFTLLLEPVSEKDIERTISFLNQKNCALVITENGIPQMILGDIFLSLREIHEINDKSGIMSNSHTAYLYKEIDKNKYLFLILDSLIDSKRTFKCLKHQELILHQQDIDSELDILSINNIEAVSVKTEIKTGTLFFEFSHAIILIFIIMLFSLDTILSEKVFTYLFPVFSYIFNIIILNYEKMEIDTIYLLFFYLLYVFLFNKPFRFLCKNQSKILHSIYILHSALIVFFFIANKGPFILYYRLHFYIILLHINLILICFFKNYIKTNVLVKLLILVNLFIPLLFILVNEIELHNNIRLKLKTISLEEENLAEMINLDILNSLDRDMLYDQLLSGKVENEAFYIYKNSIASYFLKDITILLFDSRTKIIDRFSLRDNLEHINIENYIEQTFDKGPINIRVINDTGSDILISSELFMKDNLIGGGILIAISLDYYNKELQMEKTSIIETVFSEHFHQLNWVKPLNERNYHYIALKNRNIINSDRIPIPSLPEDYYYLSTVEDQVYSSNKIENIGGRKYMIFHYKNNDKPLLLFIIEDYNFLYFAYISLINIFISFLSLIPFYLYFFIPFLIKRIDLTSLRVKIGLFIVLLSLVPIILVFYLIQSTLNRHFHNHSIHQIQNISNEIKEYINNEISIRTENILKSRILLDFIDNKMHYEDLERYLFSQYPETPVSEIIIRHDNKLIYELRDPDLEINYQDIHMGLFKYKIVNDKLMIHTYKRYRDIEAIIIFELTNAFIRKTADKYNIDIGFRNKKGFITISTYDYLLDLGLIPYNFGSYNSSGKVHQKKINNTHYPYAVYHTKIESSDIGLTIIRQKLPAYFLHTVKRLITIIFSLIFLAVLAVLTKIDNSIANNIRSFIYKLNMIKEEKIDHIDTGRVLIREFKEIANMINTLLKKIYQNNLLTNSLIENIPIGILLVDKENKIIHSNNTYEKVLFRLKEELEEFITDPVINTKISKTESNNTDNSIFKLDKYDLFLDQISKLRMIIITDITNLMELEEAKLRAEMAEKFAHDIKNPLMPIKLYTQHLSRLYKKDRSKFLKNFEDITQSILSQINIMEGILLRYSKVKKDEKDMIMKHKIKTIFDSIKNSFLIQNKEIKINFIIEDPEKYILIDQIEFFNIINNLIRNSIESIKEKGNITLFQKISHNDLIVILKDDGTGMPDSVLKKLNKMDIRSEKRGGFGIGLKLVYNFIGKMHGDIDIKSNGKGTEIIITLPGIVQ